MCGDHITVYLILEDGKVKDIHFDGSGCAISKSSASMMTECLKGNNRRSQLFWEEFQKLFNDQEPSKEKLGDLMAFESLQNTSSRVKCATLPWNAFLGAVEGKTEISTETP